MSWRLLGLLSMFLLAMIGGRVLIETFSDRPTTQWALVMGNNDDPKDARIVQYVRSRKECVDTDHRAAKVASDQYDAAHPDITPEVFSKLSPQAAADFLDRIPQTPRCARIYHFWRENRTSIQFVDE